MASVFFQRIARNFPNLKHNLKKSSMNYKPEEFIRQTFLSAFYMTTGIALSLALILAKFDVLKGVMLLFVPLVFIIFFSYLLKVPEAKILSKEKEISKEIVFAGRHLIIELESGVPLYDAFANLSKNYEAIGRY